MMQIAAIVISILLIPISVKKKFDMGVSLLVIGLIVGLIGGLGIGDIATSLIRVFTSPSSAQTLVVVCLIGLLCGLLKEYGFLIKIEHNLKNLIPNSKILIMILPAIMGTMQVPGGAAISAPFVDQLGDELNLPPPRRAAINVIFRHISMFILPFASSLIITCTIIPQVNLYDLISLNLIFSIVLYTLAYFIYISKSKPKRISKKSGESKFKSIKELLIYLSPIYIVVILNGGLGVSLISSVLISVIYSGCIGKFKDFFKHIVKYFNLKIILLLISVYYFQNIVTMFEEMLLILSNIFTSSPQIICLIIIAVTSIVFGSITGLVYVPLGIILPILPSLGLTSSQYLVYTFFVYVWSVLGYFYSPLHLCQVLTDKLIGCTYIQSLKEHFKLIVVIFPVPFILFYIFSVFIK